MPKKNWTRPRLTVLIRGKPEERVLVACKDVLPSSGPSSADSNCQLFEIEGGCSGMYCGGTSGT